MKIYGHLGICWVHLITGEIRGNRFTMYQNADRIRRTSFNGVPIEIYTSPHDITSWMEAGKPGGLKGLRLNYKRAPFVIIEGEVYDLVDKTR